MKVKGSQAIIKVLLEQGVDTVFGYPGGQVIPLYDALYDAPLKNERGYKACFSERVTGDRTRYVGKKPLSSWILTHPRLTKI